MLRRLDAYTVTLVTFLVLDATWIGFIGGPLSTNTIGELLAERVRIAPAIVFYLLHVAGIVALVLPRAREFRTLWAAAAFGAVFGLCTYGTYDLTNFAVLRGWTWQLTVIDMAWGVFVTGFAATAGAAVDRRRDRRNSTSW